MTLLVATVVLLALIIAGAPYVPTLSADTKTLFAELGEGYGRVFVDLGSGDGRVLKAAKLHGYAPVGYELNPILWLLSAVKLRSISTVRLWPWQWANLSKSDVIYIFSTSWHLKHLSRSQFPQSATIVIYGPQPTSWSESNATPVGPMVVYQPVAQHVENKLP